MMPVNLLSLFLSISRLTCAGLLVAAMSGCTTLPSPDGPAATDPVEAPRSDAPPRWWYLRFRLNGTQENEVASYLDALIADQIVAPAIARHQDDIALWRFHRRWPQDATGHQFSFIFFAPPRPAGELIEDIERTPLLRTLADEGYLAGFRVDRPPEGLATDPAATSDRVWPLAVQREWPKFIMGASRMWLGLVQAEAAKHPELDLHPRYQRVEQALDELWFNQGNHAFFHHLSALFGYKPVRILRRETITF